MIDKHLSPNEIRDLLTQGSFGIILKDGWLGRPYDNTYRASEVTCEDWGWVIQGEGVKITINQPNEAILHDNSLVIYSKHSILVKHFDREGRIEKVWHIEDNIKFYLYELKRKRFFWFR